MNATIEMDRMNPMNHLNEEDLVAMVYGEGANAAMEHVRTCAACSGAYAALRGDLAHVGRVEPPPRDEAYGERVWQAIAGSLPAYRPPARRWLGLSGPWLRGLSYAAACAALLAVAFYAGRVWEQGAAKKPAVTAAIAKPQTRQPIVVVVLGDHLDRSERLLVELKHADPDSPELATPLRDEARSLLAANRICRREASGEDDPALATALDHLDRLLEQMVNQPGGLNGAAIARLQSEMSTNELLFEVRVLRARIPERPAGGANRKGATI